MHAPRPRDKEQSKGIVYCKAKETQETVDRRSGGKDEPRDMEEMVNTIRVMLRTMGDGEISASAYDTAWVALVKNHNGSDSPQFPSTIDWISHNQLPDGSWGDDLCFLVHDRLLNTLACVIALMEWKVHGDKREKGLSFIRENIWRLAQEEEAWMPVGFEITFPSLLEIAKDLALDIPYDDPALHKIYAQRELKLKKIPREILHSLPTSLLLSIEGLRGLDWKRLLKLQLSDGSFLSSPAATAYVLMQTGDKKCLEFLDGIVSKFHGGVPFLYPIEIFERVWAVDRLERLGISYYFKTEIDEYCLEYTFRHWTKEGVTYNWHSSVKDIDTGSMAFRLLRLHGYSVSPNCYALDFPWKASLPRVETRMYLEQYGAGRDVWIGKSLYRLPLVNNDLYHNMAKADFKCFQRRCQLEWHGINKWYAENDLEVYGVTHKSALTAFFLAAANIFEPNRADERLQWRIQDLSEGYSKLKKKSYRTQKIGLGKSYRSGNDMFKALKEGPDLQKAEELDRQVDMEMQKLALLVLQNYNAADRLSNRTFLDVVKSFCYIAHCSPETVDRHIFMVMFDNLIR
ncbi:LOW QUALITY PROTEIN: syn-copalyl diphosphate synthase, chloroplastic-like [Oryza sativa Japonica Group]|uniref:LOW QUALITY PROTEIN: syn-copalyl diphosphate synthase, chloroplastic-like n=1 Tax=Oryza sativa subsp. japonica TaxID=39947 RepID=UPI00339D0BD3